MGIPVQVSIIVVERLATAELYIGCWLGCLSQLFLGVNSTPNSMGVPPARTNRCVDILILTNDH